MQYFLTYCPRLFLTPFACWRLRNRTVHNPSSHLFRMSFDLAATWRYAGLSRNPHRRWWQVGVSRISILLLVDVFRWSLYDLVYYSFTTSCCWTGFRTGFNVCVVQWLVVNSATWVQDYNTGWQQFLFATVIFIRPFCWTRQFQSANASI